MVLSTSLLPFDKLSVLGPNILHGQLPISFGAASIYMSPPTQILGPTVPIHPHKYMPVLNELDHPS